MIRKFDRVLLYAIALLVVVMVGIGIRSSYSPPKIAFVDIGKMLENYKFKKELEKKSSSGLYQIKAVIDSLQMVRKIGAGTPKLDTMLARAKYTFEKYYEQSSQDISKKVWDRLNPIMEQYGKEKDLHLLIGATGAGTVLYGDKASDVTEDLTHFINTRFEKGN